jgi:tape measure domain-containing protein
MAEKVGDLYVDLQVRMEDTGKAVSALNRAFGRLAKSSLSLRPRIDKGALAEIGKAGSQMTKGLQRSFDQLGKIRAWQVMEKNATSALKSTEGEVKRLDAAIMDAAKTSRTGAKYIAALGKGTPEQMAAAQAAYDRYISTVSKGRNTAVTAAVAERNAIESVRTAQASLASGAASKLASVPARYQAVTAALSRIPGATRLASGALSTLGSGFDKMASAAERSSSRASNALDNIGNQGQKAFGVLRFLSYQVITAVERMAGAFIRSGFESAAAIGYTSAALKQIQKNINLAANGYTKLSDAQKASAKGQELYRQASLGAAKASDRMTQSFIQFAQNTPFTLDQIQELGQQLLLAQSGLKASTGETFKLLPVMRSLGDIAAATGKGVEGMRTAAYVLQQIGQSGQIMGDDLRQLHNAIPNWRNIIAKQMGIPVKDLTLDVAKSTKGINALFKGLAKGDIGNFGGVLAAQNATIAGQFQRMKESVSNGIGQIINSFAPVLEPALHAAGDMFYSFSQRATKALKDPATQAAMKRFVSNVQSTFSNLKAGGKSSGLFDAIGAGSQAAVKHIQVTISRIQTLFGNFTKGFTDSGGTAAFAGIITNLQAAFTKLSPILTTIGNNIMTVLSPAFTQIGQMIGGQLLPAIQRFIPAIAPIAGFLLKIFGGALVGALKGVVNVVEGIIKIITGILNVFTGLLTGNWSLAWKGLKGIVMGALQGILGVIQVWLNVSVINFLRGGFLKIIPDLFRAGWGIVRGTTVAAVKGIGAAIRGLPAMLRSVAINAMAGLARAFSSGRSKAVSIIRALPGLMVSALRVLGGLLAAVARGALTLMASAIRAYAHVVITALKAVVTKLPGAVAGAVAQMVSVGHDIISGIARGISGAVGMVESAVKSLASHIPGWAKKILNIGSPSRVMAKEVGRWIPAGIAVGIESNAKTVEKAMVALAIKVGKAGEKGASKIVTKFAARLNGIAGVLDRVNKRATAAQGLLKTVTDLRNSYIDMFKGWEDVSSLGAGTDANGNSIFSFSKALTDIEAAKKQVKDIAGLSKRALSLGISKDTLDAVLNLGPEKAQQWFNGIISGGRAVAAQVNSYFSTFASAGGTLGDNVTRAFNHATVASATAFVNALGAQQKTLQAQFANLAHSFGTALIAELNSTKKGINVGYGPGKKHKKKPKKHAAGALSFRGGMAIAGENGPELLDLPPRTRIHTAPETERMVNNGPVELSEESVQRLAAAILAGAARVSSSAVQGALTGLAVRT